MCNREDEVEAVESLDQLGFATALLLHPHAPLSPGRMLRAESLSAATVFTCFFRASSELFRCSFHPIEQMFDSQARAPQSRLGQTEGPIGSRVVTDRAVAISRYSTPLRLALPSSLLRIPLRRQPHSD